MMYTNFPIMIEHEKDGAYLLETSLFQEDAIGGQAIHTAIGTMQTFLAAYLQETQAKENLTWIDDEEYEFMIS
jgi:hypothetical protein